MYDADLLERSNYPRFQGELPGARRLPLVNSSCGDRITIYLQIKNDQIIDGRWQGQGCAIALTSADFFIESIIGKTVNQALEIKSEFTKMILGQDFDPQKVACARPLEMVARMPARVNCAKLAWGCLDRLHDLHNRGT